MMHKYNIKEEDLWNINEDKNLWNAKLFHTENTNNSSINSALTLYKIVNGYCSNKIAKNYFSKSRTSLCKSFNNADILFMQGLNQKIEFELRSYEFINLLKQKIDINISKDILLKSSNIYKQIDNLVLISKQYNHNLKSRIFLAISKIIKEQNLTTLSSKNFEDMCYNEIKTMIRKPSTLNINKNNILNSAYVKLPIRVNFAGGWSDTPPYCNENGGIVLNAAFKLNGVNPIKAKIEKNTCDKIILKSIDLNIEKEIKNIDELKNCYNPNDPFSLLKASLLISSIVKKDDLSIKSVIERLDSRI